MSGARARKHLDGLAQPPHCRGRKSPATRPVGGGTETGNRLPGLRPCLGPPDLALGPDFALGLFLPAVLWLGGSAARLG